MNIQTSSFSGKPPNYSKLPQQMAKKLGNMVRSGRTTAELATEAHSYISGGASEGLLTADNQKPFYWENFHWRDRERSSSIQECRTFVAESLAKAVRVRNPWGKNDPRDQLKSSPHFDGKNDGIFTLEMPEFAATFDCMFTTRPKAESKR